MPPRSMARLAALAVLLPLAACSLEGDAYVDAKHVVIDAVLTHDASGPIAWMDLCFGALTDQNVTTTPLPSPAGTVACRVSGTVALSESPRMVWPSVVQGVDHVFVRVPAINFIINANGDEEALESIDLTIHFPGDVVSATGGAQVFGSTVRWRDADAVRREEISTSIVAPPAPEPPEDPTVWAPDG